MCESQIKIFPNKFDYRTSSLVKLNQKFYEKPSHNISNDTLLGISRFPFFNLRQHKKTICLRASCYFPLHFDFKLTKNIQFLGKLRRGNYLWNVDNYWQNSEKIIAERNANGRMPKRKREKCEWLTWFEGGLAAIWCQQVFAHTYKVATSISFFFCINYKLKWHGSRLKNLSQFFISIKIIEMNI